MTQHRLTSLHVCFCTLAEQQASLGSQKAQKAFLYGLQFSENVAVHIASMRGLACLAQLDANQADIIKGGVVDMALQYKDTDNYEMQKHIARTLANVSLDRSHQVEVVSQGAVDVLLLFLKTENSAPVMHSLRALANLAQNHSNQVELMKDEYHLLEAIGLHFESTQVEMKLQLARLIGNLALNGDNQRLLVEKDFHRMMVDFLSVPDGATVVHAARGLANIAQHATAQGALIKTEMLDALIALRDTKLNALRLQISRCFGNLSLSEANHARMSAAGVHNILLSYLDSDAMDVRVTAVRSLGNLCLNESVQEVVVRKGLLGIIQPMIDSGNRDLDRNIARTLATLSGNPSNAPAVRQENVHCSLIQLSYIGNAAVQFHCARGLANIIRTSADTEEVVSDGSAQVLLYLAYHAPDVSTRKHAIAGLETLKFVVSDDSFPTNPNWVPDRLAPCCFSCQRRFTVRRRRHHCRKCGGVFCAEHSAGEYRVDGLHNQRVCVQCLKTMTSLTHNSLKPSTLEETSDKSAPHRRDNKSPVSGVSKSAPAEHSNQPDMEGEGSVYGSHFTSDTIAAAPKSKHVKSLVKAEEEIYDL